MKKKIFIFLIAGLLILQGFGFQIVLADWYPKIDKITWKQLHKNYEEIPHRYQLYSNASDADNDSLTYEWLIDCGEFVGDVHSDSIEWIYYTPGACIKAKVMATVVDSTGLKVERVQYVFQETDEFIRYTEYPLPEKDIVKLPEDTDIKDPEDIEGSEDIEDIEDIDIEDPEDEIDEIEEIAIEEQDTQEKKSWIARTWEAGKENWKEMPLWLKILAIIIAIIVAILGIVVLVKIGVVAAIAAAIKGLIVGIAGLVKAGVPVVTGLLVKFWPMVLKWLNTGKTWIGKTLDTTGKVFKWCWRKITGKP